MQNDWRNDSIQKAFYGIAAVSLVALILLINYWLVTGLWTGTSEAWLVEAMFASVAVAALAIVSALVRRICIFQVNPEQ